MLLQENRLEEAAATCRQFEVLETNDVDNYLACAWVYYWSDRKDSADKMMQRLRKSSQLPEYQLLLALGKMKQKQYEAAQKIIEVVRVEHKGTAIGLTAQELAAEIAEAQGRLDGPAGFIYKQIVGDDPTRGRAQWGLGRYYLARGDLGRARQHFEMTTKLWPQHLGSRFNLVVMSLNENNLSDGLRWLKECLRVDKSDPGVLEQLGVLFEKRGRLTEAVKYWQRAIEINKDAPIAKEKLATNLVLVIDSMIENKEYARALSRIEASTKAIEQPKMLLRRARIYFILGSLEKATADYTVYLAQNPKDVEAIRDLGICYLQMKEWEHATAQFLKAIQEEPNEGSHYGWLARVYEATGDFRDARDVLKKAIDLLKEPAQVEKANRRLSSIEKRLNRQKRE